MKTKELLMGAAVSAPFVSAGCAELPSGNAAEALRLSDREKVEFILRHQLAGNSYDGKATYHSILSRDMEGIGSIFDATGQRDMPKKGAFEIHDMFQEGGHYFATVVEPNRDGSHLLRIFIDDCVTVGWHNEGVPNLVIAMERMYDPGVDDKGIVIGNRFNEEVGRRYVNLFLEPDPAAKEFYTAALNALAEKHASGKVSKWSLYRLEMARVRLVDSIMFAEPKGAPEAGEHPLL